MFHLADVFCFSGQGVGVLGAPLGLDKTGVVVLRQRESQTLAQEPAGEPLAIGEGKEPAHFSEGIKGLRDPGVQVRPDPWHEPPANEKRTQHPLENTRNSAPNRPEIRLWSMRR